MTIDRSRSDLGESASCARRTSPLCSLLVACATGLFLLVITGCETPPSTATVSPTATSTPAEIQAWQEAGKQTEMLTIREGDGLKISFPGAPKLDTAQQVRADGIITLDIVGEVKVVGLTPKELEQKLAGMFANQLVSNEVTVAITSSTFDVFVSGAVLRPGKITTSKPITVLQAIMEAGFDPAPANLANVMIIREKNAKYSYLTLNVQLVLDGKDTQPFYLRPSDTVKVPKKITVF